MRRPSPEPSQGGSGVFLTKQMPHHICLIDESGDSSPLPSADSPVQPVLVVAGLMVSESALPRMESEFLALKKKVNPGAIPPEVKGRGLREALRSAGVKRRDFTLLLLDRALDILENASATVAGQVWVKPVGGEFDGNAAYVSSAMFIARQFQRFLAARESRGKILCDHRRPAQQSAVARAFLERKSRAAGDPFSRLPDSPSFTDSRQSPGVQLADWLCSALVAPLAATVYCDAQSPHAHRNYLRLRERFGRRLMKIQEDDRANRRGLRVAAGHSRLSLFRAPAGIPAAVHTEKSSPR